MAAKRINDCCLILCGNNYQGYGYPIHNHCIEFRTSFPKILYQARIDGPLIPEPASGARGNRCNCHLNVGRVLGRVVNQLGHVVDINKGKCYRYYFFPKRQTQSKPHGFRSQ